MKKNLFIAAIAASTILGGLSSCSSDDNNANNGNQIDDTNEGFGLTEAFLLIDCSTGRLCLW